MATADAPLQERGTTQRRVEFDLLRALVVVGLIFFHSALVFDTRDDYYVKNDQTTEATTFLAGLAVVWAMPLLFLVAGTGVWHALRRRSACRFVGERVRRLLVPLVFATVTIVPVPVWFSLRSDPGYGESYWQFLARFLHVRPGWSNFPFVLDGAPPDELFETGHLWFVVLLLTFSVILLPVFLWLNSADGSHQVAGLAEHCAGRGLILLPALPLAAISAALGMEEPHAAWSRWAYLAFFLYGFVFAADSRFALAMQREARLAAALGLATFLAAGLFLGRADEAGADLFVAYDLDSLVGRALFGLAGWLWLVAILGFLGRRWRPARPGGVRADRNGAIRRIGDYLNEAVLPIYILHQPVIVPIAFYVVALEQPAAIKYVLIVLASLLVTFATYDLVVRRNPVTRFLFGMKPPLRARAARPG
jgi:surface polysaccharide O-acyltransferase-like enzyme